MSENQQNNIRISAKAIIIHHEKILLIKYRSESDEWFTLPGGGQLFGEPLTQTLIRECREESRYEITPGELVFIREYIGKNHEFADFDRDVHQLEMMFLATLLDNESDMLHLDIHSDRHQIAAQWIDLAALEQTPLFPAALRSLIKEKKFPPLSPVYLGDVN
ncbi:NUDIX domain-containing protein [Serratia marcescens]|uniref:NUDIX domain-containing protein n=1 Tax=Serratia marcescens TaxID=615 RepID=UPI00191C5A32|nr:NUDIX domain-containing protein [Serratia marcescens]